MPENPKRYDRRGAENRGVGMPPDFSIRLAGNDDIPAIRAVLLAVRAEYGVLGAIGGDDPDLDDLEDNYFRRGGCFEVVTQAAGRIVGCAGLHPLSPCRAELGKMYLEKSCAGRGLGRQLLEDLLAAARKSGFQEVWLETNSVLTEAITLYTRFGFQPVATDHRSPQCDVAYLLPLG